MYLRPAVRLATAADAHLPLYDYTTLSAMNTCPTWGILRYGLGKTFANSARPLALEFGAAMHDAFAAIRLLQLYQVQGYPQHASHRAVTLLGASRWHEIIQEYDPKDEPRANAFRMGVTALRNNGYVNDEKDKKRTIENGEEALASYLNDWDFDEHKVWIQDKNNPLALVGCEIIFDLVIEFICDRVLFEILNPPPQCWEKLSETTYVVRFRYAGRIDGLHVHGNSERPFVHENKTAARLDEAWKQSFSISHQITGYCVAATIIMRQHVSDAYAIGLQIPQPRGYFGGVVWEPVHRGTHNYERWLQWLVHTLEGVWRYDNDPIHAPKYSHSCNRYFRPCSFIPFCYGDEGDQQNTLEQMVEDKWTPLRDMEVPIDG
jgi:hypothetical protein